MTTELEQEFFKVFGIEKIECCKHFKYFDSKCDRLDSTEKCLDCIGTNKIYPKITDRILLKLICKAYCLMFSIQGSSIELLKENILKEFIYWHEDVVKSEIQQLFKEEE